MPNMPKPEPYASPNMKKPMTNITPAPIKQPIGALKKLPPDKLKAILALLLKMGGASRGESPMPYSRLGQPMD